MSVIIEMLSKFQTTFIQNAGVLVIWWFF